MKQPSAAALFRRRSPFRLAFADGEPRLAAARLAADVTPHGGAQRGVEHSVHAGVDWVHDEGDGCSKRGAEEGEAW